MARATVDQAKLEELQGRLVGDFAAALTGTLIHVGDQLGLYTALRRLGPVTSTELANETGTVERLVREWLVNQTASGITIYDPQTDRYTLPPEAAEIFANDDAATSMGGFYSLVVAMTKASDKIIDAFRTGKGLSWGDHTHELFDGTARFFRTAYLNNLTQTWLPAVDGAVELLEAGAKVADVGCGYGVSTILLAKAFPNSTFVGFDTHAPSIERARKLAAEEGVADRVSFEVADAVSYPGSGYDVIAFFDCLHDMVDPQAAVDHAKRAVSDRGVIMLIEPKAEDSVEGNINPVGRIYSAASTMVCVPNSLNGDGIALGAIAGPKRLGALFDKAGYGEFGIAIDTGFNIVYRARA